MSLYVMLKQRDLAADTPLSLPVVYRVNSYSWHALGGPEAASITVYGQARALYDLVDVLRCPVEIYNERGEFVWWGFVEAVEVRVDALEVGVDLATMANRVQVSYTQGSYQANTAFAQDNDSVTTYGQKELIIGMANVDLAVANARRDTTLAAMRYPLPTVATSERESSFTATLRCRGWWDTLGWHYYGNVGTGSVDSTVELADIFTAAGQFFTSWVIDSTSGVTMLQFRDGYTTALTEANAILLVGTASNRRLLATVDRFRRVRVYEEAAQGSADYLLRSTGELRTHYDTPVSLEACPVGVWCKLVDLLLASPDVSKMANPGVVMLERAQYDALTNTRTLAPRVHVYPWQKVGL